MPGWYAGEDGKRIRPMVAMWVSTSSGLASSPDVLDLGDEPFPHALQTLMDFASSDEGGSARPSLVEVKDPGLAEYLNDALSGTGVAIACSHKLDALQPVMADLAEHMAGRPEPPSALDARGVTVDRL